MSWAILTTDDVLGEFTPQETATLKNIQGAVERLPGILANTIAVARGSIRAGGYSLGTEGTVPDQLRLDIIAIARWRWLAAFPQMKALQTDARKAAHDDAQANLKDVSNQKLNVEAPDADTTNVPAGNWNSENKIVPRAHPVPRPASQFQTQGDDYANPDGPSDQNLDT